MELNRVLVEQFIAAEHTPSKELILDIDAFDIPLQGDQEQKEFYAHYEHHCYLPLSVLCGNAILACVLRRSRIDGAKHASAVITRLEFGAQGNNLRFVVTNLKRPASELYDDLYCQRGEAENLI